MCVLLVGNPALMDGWGCCRRKTYNGLWRDCCKHCNEPHHVRPCGRRACLQCQRDRMARVRELRKAQRVGA